MSESEAQKAIRETLEELEILGPEIQFPEFNIPVEVKLALMYDREPLRFINWPPNKALEVGRDSNYRIRNLVHDSLWGLEEDA